MKLTGLKGRIPVEPLDDERFTNIERRIVANAADAAAQGASRVRTPRFGLGMAFAVAAVVAIGAGFAGWQLRGGGAKSDVATAPVHVDTTGDRAVLDIGDARIQSDSFTNFTVTRPDGGVLVTMKRGKVELQVGKRGNRAPLVVAAGDTRVVVVGTQFSVDYGDGTSGVDVRVTEGVVKVERHQKDVRVAAGQAWTTKRGVIALAELPDRSTQIASAGGANGDGANGDGANGDGANVGGANGDGANGAGANGAGAGAGANGAGANGASANGNGANGAGANGAGANGAGANGDANGNGANGGGANGGNGANGTNGTNGANGANGARNSLGGTISDDAQIEIDTATPDVLRDRQSTIPNAKVPTAGAKSGGTQSGGNQNGGAKTGSGAGRKLGGPEVSRQAFGSSSGSASAGDLHKQVRDQAVLAPLDLGLGLRPEESIAKYREIVNSETGARAAIALYSIAAQEHSKLGRNGDALKTLDQYVRRFAGTEYKDTYHAALWLRVRILCAKVVDDRCRQAAYTHLHQAAGTPAAKVSELVTLQPR